MNGNWIFCLRVSTDKQGKFGLGIEAQRNSVAEYLNGGSWKLVKQHVEVESGKRTDRPMLAEGGAAADRGEARRGQRRPGMVAETITTGAPALSSNSLVGIERAVEPQLLNGGQGQKPI